MFNENLKRVRKQKNISQEELAYQLHITRQTISKWERGLSLPDADLLLRLAQILDLSVSDLLGQLPEEETINDIDKIAKRLEAINVSLVERNRRSKKTWKIIKWILLVLLALLILYTAIGMISFDQYSNKSITTIEEVRE